MHDYLRQCLPRRLRAASLDSLTTTFLQLRYIFICHTPMPEIWTGSSQEAVTSLGRVRTRLRFGLCRAQCQGSQRLRHALPTMSIPSVKLLRPHWHMTRLPDVSLLPVLLPRTSSACLVAASTAGIQTPCPKAIQLMKDLSRAEACSGMAG